MESQILYESLTKPRCDLDNNMNKTHEVAQGNDGVPVIVNTAISSAESSFSGQETKTGETEIRNVLKSKLLEQLQTPLEIPAEKTQVIHKGDNGQSFSYREHVKDTEAASANGLNSEHSDAKDKRQTEVTSSQSLVPVQDSNTVVSTNEVRSETSGLASPTLSFSSGRSMSGSPLPSPGTNVTSQNEVSSSKSLPGGLKRSHKRRRRGSAWTDAETEYLMEVWARQTDIIKQKGGDESVTCAPVYRLISRSMAEQGWDKTWEQCKTRIHTLKRAYKITKDEIAEGCQTITYCRHFDKLEIICGDNSQVSPGMLSFTLEQKRKVREIEGKSGKKQPVRRKLTVGENPNLVKKANVGSSLINTTNTSQFQGQNSVSYTPSVVSVQTTPSTNTLWFPPLQTQQQQRFQLQQQQPQIQLKSLPTPVTVSQTVSGVQQPLQASVLPAAPMYHYQVPLSSGNDGTQVQSYSSSSEVNNNKASVKSEKPETKNNEDISVKHYEQGLQWNVLTSQQASAQTLTVPQSNTGNDIERMRLDLEMRKLEVERNKIEMEERQRREDRDHQYRMMQLLLFGLGQQNISQVLSGQSSDVTQAHDAVLSRALENGLVPGGSQKVNEKGLSFSEL